jgi:hypothetical protein
MFTNVIKARVTHGGETKLNFGVLQKCQRDFCFISEELENTICLIEFQSILMWTSLFKTNTTVTFVLVENAVCTFKFNQ